MPSIVFAEATWYGSLRSTVEFGGGSDATFKDGASRWGIKGSSEVSEGLTAVAHFAHHISTSDASLSSGRLAYVGLSGGFGSITAGHLGAAGYGNVGVITDNSNYYGDSGMSSRHSNVLSYAYSSGSIGFQVDLTVDGKQDTGGHVDKGEFGLTVGIGDLGKVAVAYINQKDTMMANPYMHQALTKAAAGDAPAEYADGKMITVTVAKNYTGLTDADKTVLDTDGLDAIVRSAKGKYSAGTCNANKTDPADDCTTVNAYAVSQTAIPSGESNVGTVTTTETYYAKGRKAVDKVFGTAGYKATHVAFEFGLGGISTYVGHSQSKENGADKKSKTTHFGARGALGDTGMSFLVQARNVKGADGMNSSPWLLGLSRSLGGGAAVHFEHGNSDNGMSGKTRVGLQVDF